MDKEISELLKQLESGDNTKISSATMELPKIAKKIVELPQKQIAKILEAILNLMEKGHPEYKNLSWAFTGIIRELGTKYDILPGPDVIVAFSWYIGKLEREEFRLLKERR